MQFVLGPNGGLIPADEVQVEVIAEVVTVVAPEVPVEVVPEVEVEPKVVPAEVLVLPEAPKAL